MNMKITPSRFLKKNVYNPLPAYKKTRLKVSNENFIILEYGEHDKLLQLNFNCRQLRVMARFYNQKRSGNKPYLLFILYNFLKYSKYACTIQKIVRGYLYRKYYQLRGPAFIKRDKCVNETDFITLEKLETIPQVQFITYADKEGYIFGFDIRSLHNLFKHKRALCVNPYTQKSFPTDFKNKIKRLLKLSKLFGDNINIEIEDTYKGLSKEKQVELFAISVFQKIDNLGNHSNAEWLLSLNSLHLLKFMRELRDIWIYRANLSSLVKRNICPPNGNPFIGFNILQTEPSITKSKHNILKIMDNLVTKGVNRDSKILGALFILTALTLVSKDAAEARPELYNSAVHF